jgi:eukaryotic-like serine/threonine-protein kinase
MRFVPCPECGDAVDVAMGICARDGRDIRARALSRTSAPLSYDHGSEIPNAIESEENVGDTTPFRRSSDDALLGARAGRYILEARIGEGGMGAVYRAVHEDLGQHVAIKVLTGAKAFDEARLQRFLSEGRTAARVQHVNVVKIFDFGYSETVGHHLVMEMLSGVSLSDLLSAGPIPEARAIAIALQIADAIAAAHAHGVIHRDIKPSNVFVESHAGGDVVKVLDFGIAKTELALSTKSGIVVGTPRYMSPEQWSAERVTHATDQYSFGALLYEIATGKLPFPDGAAARRTRAPPTAALAARRLPEPLSGL